MAKRVHNRACLERFPRFGAFGQSPPASIHQNPGNAIASSFNCEFDQIGTCSEQVFSGGEKESVGN